MKKFSIDRYYLREYVMFNHEYFGCSYLVLLTYTDQGVIYSYGEWGTNVPLDKLEIFYK